MTHGTKNGYVAIDPCEARALLRVHIHDNPHGSLRPFIRRLAICAASDLREANAAACFIGAFLSEFEALAMASAADPVGQFARYAQQFCLELLDSLDDELRTQELNNALANSTLYLHKE